MEYLDCYGLDELINCLEKYYLVLQNKLKKKDFNTIVKKYNSLADYYNTRTKHRSFEIIKER